MTRVLIIEGNTPELLAPRRARALGGTAEAYGAALARFAPGLETEIVRPYFPGYDVALVSLSGVDGVVCTGSGVDWSAADDRSRPYWALYESAFEAGLPVLGSCWGLQVGAVVLGGTVGAADLGVEVPVARDITLTAAGRAHALHAGRAERFDALCVHRDEVRVPPEGAVVTAANAHSAVQAMVVERDGVRFWGVQYHPEMSLGDMAVVLERFEEPHLTSAARDFSAPTGSDALARQGIGEEISEPSRHGLELVNWLGTCLGLATSGPRPLTATV